MANRVKEVSAFNGTSWGAAVPLGADDVNIDITSGTTQPDGSPVSGVTGDTATSLDTSAVTVSQGDTNASAWTKFNRFRKRIVNNLSNYIQGSIATVYNASGSNNAVYSTGVMNDYMTNVIGYSGTTTPSKGTIVAQLSAASGISVNIPSFSSLPQTVTNSLITDKHKVYEFILSNPSVQTGDWIVTTSEGSLTIAGTISGSTALELVLGAPTEVI